MYFISKQLNFLHSCDSITKYNLSHLNKNQMLCSIVLDLPLLKLEKYSQVFSKNSNLNLKLKAALYFYLFLAKYSYFNFKSTKLSSGYSFKIILTNFIDKAFFLLSLCVEEQKFFNYQTNPKHVKYLSILTSLKAFRTRVFLSGEFLPINIELSKTYFKEIKLKNFFITINFNFKKNSNITNTGIFWRNNLFLWGFPLI